jgi:para-nitrobenzyl esterase
MLISDSGFNRAFVMKAICLLVLAALGCVAFAGTVKTEGGLIEGTVEDGLSVYRGIPFGAPPVGVLRWRAPQPAAKWQGLRAANKLTNLPA